MKHLGVAVAVVVWVAAALGASSTEDPQDAPRPPAQRLPAQAQASAPVAPSRTPEDYKALVDKYCVTCHNSRLQTGGLSLDAVEFRKVPESAEALEKVVRKLGTGAMPPQGLPRPDKATHDAFVTWLAAELNRHAALHPNPGRAILRRLNRTEYANAVRDLLDLNIDVSGLLPVDNSSYGFDNIADVLGVSPVLMERYLTAARRISAVAVGDAAEIAVTAESYRARPDLARAAGATN
jgi:mono/diheme cytochrome c family protein